MKKKILSAVVAAAALFGAYTAQQASSTVALSDAQIENIEALGGDGDNPNSGWKCPGAIQEYQIHSLKDDWNDEVYKGYDCMCLRVVYHAVMRRCL